jgi:tetratricopeptide (TPR) repeat protein
VSDPFSLSLAAKYAEAEAVLAGRRDVEADAIRAYLANARGDFEDSLEIARRALRRASSPEVRSRLLVTAGSAARQLRRYAIAWRFDQATLLAAPNDAATAHASIGLAADAVGRGDPDDCEAQLQRAAAVAPREDWRVAVRLGWVQCEHALMTGRAADGVEAAQKALAFAMRSRAPRHEAKSALFLGVAQRDAGDSHWAAPLRHARAVAERIGAKAISSVAAAELARTQKYP